MNLNKIGIRYLYLFLMLLLTLLVGCKTNINGNEEANLSSPTQTSVANSTTGSSLNEFSDDKFIYPILQEGKVGYINSDGDIIIEPQYQYGEMPSGELMLVKKNNKYGFVDSLNNVIIDFKFDFATSFSEGLTAVQIGDKWGYINESGNFIIESIYDSADQFKEGMAPIGIGDKIGFVDKKGNVRIEPKFSTATPFSGGLASVEDEGIDGVRCFFIDNSGNMLFDQSFDGCGSFSEKRAWIMKGNRYSDDDLLYGFIDDKGKVVIEQKYSYATDFSDGLALVGLNGKLGYIDTSGKVVVDFRFEGAFSFSEGLAAVKEKDKWGFIGKNGKWVIQPTFDEVKEFKGELAEVKDGEQWIYINKKGKCIWKQSDSEENVSNQTEETQKNKTWGFGMEDIAIKGQNILSMDFMKIKKMFGEPKEIRTYKVEQPAAGDDEFRYFGVAVYEGIEFEFYSEELINQEIPDNMEVVRFDLVNSGVVLDCGLRTGMSLDEVFKNYGQLDVHDIDKEKEEGESEGDIEHTLRNSKPDNYYSKYERAMIIYCDTEKFEEPPLAMALVLLLKEDKVDRIVFGYPTAN